MKKFLPKITILIFFFFFTLTYSQSRFSHEAGLNFGVASFQTDFGQRNNFPSANQSTLSVGVVHYLKFFGSQYNWRSGTSFFSEHFKLKTEFNYLFNTNIQHEGAYVELDNEIGDKLKVMKGQIKMYNIGTNLEFYFFQLEDYTAYFTNKKSVNPFVSLGLHYSAYDPDILVNDVSLEGKEEPHLGLIDKWQEDAIYLDSGSAFGISAGAGVRFGLGDVDFVIDGRWQHFFSDKIDGLDDFSSDTGSKYNDTVIFVNIGIVYTFGKY